MKAWAAVCLLLLAACADTRTDCAQLPGGLRYCLQPHAGPAFAADQALTIRYREQTMTMLWRMRADAGGLHCAGLSPLGQTLIRLDWVDGVLSAAMPPELQRRLAPALLPALIQIALWPPDAVRAGLSAPGRLDSDGKRRVLGDGERELLVVVWSGDAPPYDSLSIEAPAAGLSLEARTLTEESQP
ncbi:MAG: DUF3261 domain-containing protein [Rhodocyclaceae bacterium]|nr:DUF3261 domain-containing protein [Rhodocyclaceae bacterium]